MKNTNSSSNNDAIAAIKVLALLTVHVSLCSTDFEDVGSQDMFKSDEIKRPHRQR